MKVLLVAPKDPEAKILTDYINKLSYDERSYNFGVEIVRMRNGLEAFKAVEEMIHEKDNFMLVITAEETEGIKGSQLADFLHSDHKLSKIPVILYSRSVSPQLRGLARSAGVHALLNLPLNYETMRLEVERLVHDLVIEEDMKRNQVIEEYINSHKDAVEQEELDVIYLESLKKINKYMKLAPWSVTGQISQAKIHCGMTNYEKAVPILKSIIQKRFDIKVAHELLSMCYKRLGKSYEDLAELEALREKNPASSHLNHQLGEAYIKEGDLEKAEASFKRTIKLIRKSDSSRTRAMPHVSLGAVYMFKAEEEGGGKLNKEAAREFETGKTIDPTLLSAYFGLATVYKKMGEGEKARKVINEIISSAPSTSGDWLTMFHAYLEKGDVAKAKVALKEARGCDPENQITLVEAAHDYMRHNMHAEALDILEDAIKINPSDKRMYNFLGMCCRKLGLNDRGLEAYDKALQIDDRDSSVYFNKGRMLENLKDVAGAEACYKKALNLDPSLSHAHNALKRLGSLRG